MGNLPPDTSKDAIGRRLVAARTARGLNGATTAQRLGLSPQRYGNYENGRSIMPPDVLARFWQLTGATSDYVLFARIETLPMELADKIREIEAGPARKRGAA